MIPEHPGPENHSESQTEPGSRHFGRWLALEIGARGTNQNQLAIKIGVSRAGISRVIDGQQGVSREMVRKIAEGLGCDPVDAFRAWLEEDEQPAGPARLVTEPNLIELISSYERLTSEQKRIVDRFVQTIYSTRDPE